MEINFELQQDDLIKFSREYAKTQSVHKFLSTSFSVIALIFLFADFIYLIISGYGNFKSIDEVFLSFFIRVAISLGIIAAVYLFAVIMQKRATDQIDTIHNNGILCEHKIVIDENEFIEITDVNTSRHSWLSIGEVRELDDFVFINVNFVGTHFIPKRYFNDQDHIKEFVETAQHFQLSAKEKFNTSHLAEFDRNSNLLNDGK